MESSDRDDKKGYKGGLILFLFINSSLIFLIMSPYIQNPITQYIDNQFLAQTDDRILNIRRGTFTLTFKNQSTGLPINFTDIEYDLLKHDFIFGCNIFALNKTGIPSGDLAYGEYFANLFNLAVIPFYWAQYEPQQGNYTRDTWINTTIIWCEDNNITTKGHPLSWRNPSGYPSWLPEDLDEVWNLLKARIDRIAEMYKDRIEIWDVVNEPTHLPPMGGQTLYNYVANCFNWVNDKDSNALLTINEYGIMGHDFGYGPYYNLINELKENHIPVNVIGLQGREPRTDWIPAVEIWNTLEGYSTLGLPIHITEITWPSYPLPITNSWKKGLWSQLNQADYAEAYYKTCFSHPNVDAIIWWDLWDGASWVQEGGMIDANFEPKLIYNRLDNLINNEWHSSGGTYTGNNGVTQFNGFYGTYNISIPSLGFNCTINAPKGGASSFEILIP